MFISAFEYLDLKLNVKMEQRANVELAEHLSPRTHASYGFEISQ